MYDEDGVLRVPFLRTAYNYDRDAVSRETALVCPEEGSGRTQQQFAEEVDINTIVKRFGLTGQLPDTPIAMPLSGDFSDAVTDYHSAMNMVLKADDAFMELPAETRARFDHDPGKLMAFMEDSANLDEARKLGLAVPAAPIAEPLAVRVVAPEAPGTSST